MQKTIDRNAYIPLKEAHKHLPIPFSYSGIRRWVREGVNGKKLEVMRVGVRVFTTPKAIEEFLDWCNGK
jgi:hypothetical protein